MGYNPRKKLLHNPGFRPTTCGGSATKGSWVSGKPTKQPAKIANPKAAKPKKESNGEQQPYSRSLRFGSTGGPYSKRKKNAGSIPESTRHLELQRKIGHLPPAKAEKAGNHQLTPSKRT
jgi:hypothetical protein